MRVTAVDPDTNTEITMVGDPKASQSTLENLAMRKLRYVIAKNMTAKGS